MTYTKTAEEIQQALRNQVSALKASCRAFDNGEQWEAARIAAAIHMILYDSGGKSRSILHQLGVKNDIEFICSGEPIDPRNLAPTHPLVMIKSGPTGMSYAPLIERPPFKVRTFKFKKWWREPVFAASRAKWTISREALITNIRNQDGGGHFDGSLKDDNYVEFSRSPQWVVGMANGEQVGLMGLELNTVRQVGWEVLQSLENAGLG
jgi:hypothetical protein